MAKTTKIIQDIVKVKRWGSNAKVLVATEILWGLPMTWFFFYQVIFMKSLGMSEVLIGLLVSLPLIFQMFMPILGGHLADKFGRKKVFMAFDSTGWIGAMIMWYTARGPLQIFIAMVLEGIVTTTYGVWETLLVEDTELSYRTGIYSYIQIIYIFAGFLTPIAGILISFYGLDQGCRYLAITSLISLIAMFAIRQAFLKESEIGKILSKTSDKDAPTPDSSYLEAVKGITKDKKLFTVFLLTIIGSVQYSITSTYRPLYLTDTKALALDMSIISVIPMSTSIISLILLTLVVPKLGHSRIRGALLCSYACGILGLLVLMLAPRGNLALAILSAMLDSARYVAIYSILRVLLVNTIDEASPFARAKVMSLVTMFSAMVMWPMPIMGGYLYALNPSLPFALCTLFLALSIVLILRMK
jgi:hypothetical protein